MFTRLLCSLLFLGLLLQTTEATPSIIVVAQYIPKIISLSVKVAVTTGNGTKEILDTQNEIKSLVTSAENAIHAQVAILERYVEELKKESNQAGRNISSCIEQEKQGINSTDLRVLEECRLQDSVKHLYSNSLQLAKEEVVLQARIQWCVVYYTIHGDDLKKCFDNAIKDVEDKIDVFERDMSVTISEAKKYSSTCTKKYLDALNGTLGKVSSNFEDCVDTVDLQL